MNQISIRRIHRQTKILDDAEFNESAQIAALVDINFISKNQMFLEKTRNLYSKSEIFITPFIGLIIICLVYLVAAKIWDRYIALGLSQVLLGGYILLIGYHQWIRAECNRNVEDAMKRKMTINNLIKDNIKYLYPYVGEVFDSDIEYLTDPIENSSKILIDMYIFSELDNLEYIFLKAKFGLIFPEFSYRTVKIFIARAQNEKFAQRSKQLVIKGRYNANFQKVVNDLINIAMYRRESTFLSPLC